MREARVLAELELFASSQWGLVTSVQASRLDIGRLWLSRMSKRGTLSRIRHGVYALPSAVDSPLQDLHAAWLSTDPALSAEDRFGIDDPVAVSHTSAAAVHQLGELIPALHEFSSPNRRQTTQQDIRFHRHSLADHDITWVNGLPITSITRTIGDLAATALDTDHMSTVIRDAVEHHHISIDDLAERLFLHTTSYGASSGRELVQDLLVKAGYSPANDPAITKVIGLWSNSFNELQEKR